MQPATATPKYWSTPDTTPALRAQLELIPDGAHVLEIGTAAGHVTRALVQKGCAVVGVERDANQAILAAPFCLQMVVGNVEQLDFDHEVPGDFDVILCGDVLEHLQDPGAVLQKLLRRLSPTGYLVVSLPNIAHGSVRLSLLEGRFVYTPCGLLDATHLQFFTIASIVDLFKRTGLRIHDLRRVRIGIFDTEIPISVSRLEPSLVAELLRDPEATTYQFVFRASPSRQGNVIRDLTDPDFDPGQAQRQFAAAAMISAWIAFHETPPRLEAARTWARLALATAPTARARLYWVASFLPSVFWRLK